MWDIMDILVAEKSRYILYFIKIFGLIYASISIWFVIQRCRISERKNSRFRSGSFNQIALVCAPGENIKHIRFIQDKMVSVIVLTKSDNII